MRPEPKSTLPGLRRRLDYRFDEPEALDRQQYTALSASDRQTYDDQRLQWFGAGFWVKTAETMNLLRSVRSYLRTTHPCAVGERNVVVDGPANVGKTTMLIRLAREVEMATGRMNPQFRDHGQVPVVYIEVAPRSTPKMIAAAILDFFGTLVGEHRRTQRELVGNAVDVMIARSTRLLIVDEMQMLRLRGRHGDDAIDTLKSITNNAGVVTVLSGIDITSRLASTAAEQIMDRGEILPLRPFSYASDEDRRRWAGLLQRFSEEMHLLDADPASLLRFTDPLHALTGGRIGSLRRVLARAMAVSLDEKPRPDSCEQISEEHLLGAATTPSAASPGPAACTA